MMMRIIIFCALSSVCYARALPDVHNPNLDYELVSVGRQAGPKPDLAPIPQPTTARPQIKINTPPPVDPNSKTFAYDPIAKTWTLVKKTDPLPKEDTLLWNQNNDKWLTASN